MEVLRKEEGEGEKGRGGEEGGKEEKKGGEGGEKKGGEEGEKKGSEIHLLYAATAGDPTVAAVPIEAHQRGEEGRNPGGGCCRREGQGRGETEDACPSL